MTQFDNVSVVKKANVYFDGKCVSHTVVFPDGTQENRRRDFPEQPHFQHRPPELMEINAGVCKVKLTGEKDWKTYKAGESFSVPGNTSFDIETVEMLDYVCHFITESTCCARKSAMPTFDIVSEVDKQELRNAVDQANKVITGRFDFKGSDSRVDQAEYVLTIFADDNFKLDQILDIVNQTFGKRNIDVSCLDKGKIEKISGNKVKQTVTVKTGVETELAKKIVKLIKDSKLKVQASIQGEAVRVTGAKRDLLQETITLVKKSITDFPLQFQNFRD